MNNDHQNKYRPLDQVENNEDYEFPVLENAQLNDYFIEEITEDLDKIFTKMKTRFEQSPRRMQSLIEQIQIEKGIESPTTLDIYNYINNYTTGLIFYYLVDL